MPDSVQERNRSVSPIEMQPFGPVPTERLPRSEPSSSRDSSPLRAPSDIFSAYDTTQQLPAHASPCRAPSSARDTDFPAAPRRSLTSWIWSNETLGALCGVAAGAAGAAFAPAMMPTATLLYNQVIWGAASAAFVGGAVTYDKRLPLYALAAAMGAVIGVACALHVAACMTPTGLAAAAALGAVVGYQVLQHRRAIALTLLATLAVGATWWAASIVGPSQFGIAVPTPRFAA